MDVFSSYLSLAFLFLFLLLVIFEFTQPTETASSDELPPGPGRLTNIGHLLHCVGSLPHRSLHQLSQQFGDLVYLQLGRVKTVVVSSADLAENVMKTHDLAYCSRPQRVAFKKFSYNFRDVAFSPSGDDWRQMRKICTIELLSNRKLQLSRGVREEEVAKMVKEIAKASSANQMTSLDISSMVVGLTQNITCKIVLGKSWSSREAVGRKKLIELLEEAPPLLGGSFFADYFPWAWWVDVVRGWHQRLEKCFRGLDDYYSEVIDEHLHFQRTKLPEQEDFVDVLLRLEKSFDLTRDHIKGILMDIFLAGIYTNSTMITWAMCELMRNRGIMKKAQEEVRRIVGSKGKVEESDLEELPYLNAVVKEAGRLHPPAPLLVPRETIQKCTLNGYEIPPNTQVLVNVFSICQDPRYWKSPQDFMPERFLEGSIDPNGYNFQFIPFGAGRSCPGIQLAMAVVELTLANLLYSFDWELPMDMKKQDIDMTEANGITVSKKTPLIVIPQLVRT